MNTALKNTITHFKINGVTKWCDFSFFESMRKHGFLISMEKVEWMLGDELSCEMKNNIVTYDNEEEKFVEMEYIPFKSIYDYITKQTVSLKNIVVKGLMNEFQTHELDTHKVLVDEFKPQIAFTYSLSTFIEKHFPGLLFQIEDNFLSLERFNNIYISSTKGPRMDVIFEAIFLVIEYDEKHHKKKEQYEADTTRDAFMVAHGYKVVRIQHGDDLRLFFLNLKKIIKDRYVMFHPETYPEYILDMFVEQGYDEGQVKLLTDEIARDIVRGTAAEDLGNTIGDMTFGMLMDYVGIDEDMHEEQITKLSKEIHANGHEYIYGDNEDIYKIGLSPNAMEYIMAFIPADNYPDILKFRKLYTGIKNTLMHIVFQTNKMQLESFHERRSVTSVVINETYRRCESDLYTEIQDVNKREHLVEKKNDVITQVYESTLSRDGRGVIRVSLSPCSADLIEGRAFVSELPQLRYSTNGSYYVDFDELAFLFEFNKRKYRIGGCVSKVLKSIKENKGLIYNATENIVYNCNLFY